MLFVPPRARSRERRNLYGNRRTASDLDKTVDAPIARVATILIKITDLFA